MRTTDDDILGWMRAILDRVDASRSEHHKRIALDWTIDGLGYDSVTTLEVITDLEGVAGVHISDDDLLEVRTIGDLVALIRRERGEER